MLTTLSLQVDGASGPLRPFRVEAREAISTLYAVDVSCTGPAGSLMGVEAIGRRATLTITSDTGIARPVPGIVERIEIMPPTLYEEAVYRVRIVPWMARLKQSKHNHIFGVQAAVSVADVIGAELTGAAREGNLAREDARQSFPYDMRLKRSYPAYNQTAQHEETNFAFVSRLAEHWGLFYFFDSADGQDRAVFADDNVFAPALPGGGALKWQPWTAGEHVTVPDRIFMFEAAYGTVPQRVYLRDYNEQLPHVPLLVSQDIDPNGGGHWVEYGANYRTPEEGALLATVRAQEHLCRRVRFTGRSTALHMAPGHVFALSGHPYDSWNKDYLVVSVTHRANAAHPSIKADADAPAYVNEFTAIPLDVQFRPERVTPRPRVDGVLNGRTETEAPLAFPHLDPNGYYRVRLPVDMSDAPSGVASQWIRKAEPYGGPANGMHFPLPAGTDVIVACVNGDPDRPVIVGAVPSADNRSVVDGSNPRMNRIRTRSGVQVTIFDAPTRPGGVVTTSPDGADEYKIG